MFFCKASSLQIPRHSRTYRAILEHTERGQCPKRLKVDGCKPKLGQKAVGQVLLPRGEGSLKVYSPRERIYCPGYHVFLFAPELSLKFLL